MTEDAAVFTVAAHLLDCFGGTREKAWDIATQLVQEYGGATRELFAAISGHDIPARYGVTHAVV